MIINFMHRAFVGSAFLAFASVSQAALFDCSSEPGYCIGEGDTVIFKYAGTESSMGLFGTLQVVGDSILASPTDFRAESLNGGPVDPYGYTADANGLMQVIAKPGYQIGAVDILEFGDYKMTEGETAVSVDGYAWIWEWGDLSSRVGKALTVEGFGADDGVGLLETRDGALHEWQATWGIKVAAAGLMSIGLELQNNLFATTSNHGEHAWIEKKISSVEVGVSTTVIPVPAAVWLFGSGLLGLVGVARRRAR